MCILYAACNCCFTFHSTSTGHSYSFQALDMDRSAAEGSKISKLCSALLRAACTLPASPYTTRHARLAATFRSYNDSVPTNYVFLYGTQTIKKRNKYLHGMRILNKLNPGVELCVTIEAVGLCDLGDCTADSPKSPTS